MASPKRSRKSGERAKHPYYDIEKLQFAEDVSLRGSTTRIAFTESIIDVSVACVHRNIRRKVEGHIRRAVS